MNDILQQYRRFVSSQYFYEGLRLTVGILTPVFAGAYLNHTPFGVTAALGVLAAGIVDHAGPLHHRINGMVAAIIASVAVVCLTRLAGAAPWAMALWIALAAFAFSLITVFGNRAAQLGTASLVLLTIFTDDAQHAVPWWLQAALVAGGGIFYFALSLFSHHLRPYKLAQQALGQCMMATAACLQLKALHYEMAADFEALHNKLAEAEREASNEQQAVREILFKTRSIVRESTPEGRRLAVAFLELVDLHEQVMSSHPNYPLLHHHFAGTPVFDQVHLTLLHLATRLTDAGIGFQSGKFTAHSGLHEDAMVALQQSFEKARYQNLNPASLEAFIALNQVVDTVDHLNRKLTLLVQGPGKTDQAGQQQYVDYRRFVSPSHLSARMLISSLSWHSNVFRFSVRMAAAMVAAYAISFLLPLGHAYWVLLTVAVILKPAYAITRRRNTDRLLGTLAGALAGAGILTGVQAHNILLACMVIFMVASFSLWRHRYLLSVAFLTAFVLLAFHLLKPGDYQPLVVDRLADTLIGSVLALAATLAIPPVWDKRQIHQLAAVALHKVKSYFAYASQPLIGTPLNEGDYKWHRKNAFVELANLGDAFQRMTQEPGVQKEKAARWHEFYAALHVLVSNIAALKDAKNLGVAYATETAWWKHTVEQHFEIAAAWLNGKTFETNATAQKQPAGQLLQKKAGELMAIRQQELQEGKMETGTRESLVKVKKLQGQLESLLLLSEELATVAKKLRQPAMD